MPTSKQPMMHLMNTQNTKPKSKESAPVRINIERMQAALDSESRRMPSGLTREEMRQQFLAFALEA